uniref:ANK_REP_REGION domain-containing protein n=1 Tax=Trichuris muris TaxID=70415 RepID=A0A5S6Q9W7_TRIMR
MHWFSNSYQRGREPNRLADRPPASKLASTFGSKTLPMEQPRRATKCYCCPYGYHIDLDFVKYAENSNSPCRQYPTTLRHNLSGQHNRRRSRNFSKYHHSSKQTTWRKPGSQEGYSQVQEVDKGGWPKAADFERRLTSPNELTVDSSISSCIFSDSLENLVSDFEETLSRSSSTFPRDVASRNDKDYCSDNELGAFQRQGSFRTPAIKASSSRTEGYTSDCAYLPKTTHGPTYLNRYRNSGRTPRSPDDASPVVPKVHAETSRTVGCRNRPSLSSAPVLKAVRENGRSGKEMIRQSTADVTMPVFFNLSGEVATDLHNLSKSMRSSESPTSLLSDSCPATSDDQDVGHEVSKSVSELLEAVHRHMKHSLNHIEHLESRVRLSPRMTSEVCRIKNEKESLAKQWSAAASKDFAGKLSFKDRGFPSKTSLAESRQTDAASSDSLHRGHVKTRSSNSLMNGTSTKALGTQSLRANDCEGRMQSSAHISLSSAHPVREHGRSGRCLSSGSNPGYANKSNGVTQSLNLNSFPSIRRLSSGTSTTTVSSSRRRRFGKLVNYTSDSEIANRSADCAASLRRSKHLLRYPHNDFGNFSSDALGQCEGSVPATKFDSQAWANLNSVKPESSSTPPKPEVARQWAAVPEKQSGRCIPSPPLQPAISSTVAQSITNRNTSDQQTQHPSGRTKYREEELEAPSELTVHSLRLDVCSNSELVEFKAEPLLCGKSANSPLGSGKERTCHVCLKELAYAGSNAGAEVPTTDHATETENCLCLVCVKLRAKCLVSRASNTDAVVMVDASTKTSLLHHAVVERHDKVVETEPLIANPSVDRAVETERRKFQCAEVNTENPGHCSVGVSTDTLRVADATSEVEKSFLLASGYWKNVYCSTDTPPQVSIGFNTEPTRRVDMVKMVDCSTTTDDELQRDLSGLSRHSTGIQVCTTVADKGCSTAVVTRSCNGTDTKDLVATANANTNTEEERTAKLSIGTNTVSNVATRSICLGTCREDAAVTCPRRSAETNTDRPKLVDTSSMTELTITFNRAVTTSLQTRECGILTKTVTSSVGTSTHGDPFTGSVQSEVADSMLDTERKKSRLSALASPLSWKRRSTPTGGEKSPVARSFDPSTPTTSLVFISEDEHSESRVEHADNNAMPLELDVELVPLETNPLQEEKATCRPEAIDDRLFNLDESPLSDDFTLEDDDAEPSGSPGARSPTHKFDITKPRPTRAFHLSKAAAVKKLLTIDKSNRMNNAPIDGRFRRSSAASSSVRVAKNKGDHLAFIESKCRSKNRQQSDRPPVPSVRGKKLKSEDRSLTVGKGKATPTDRWDSERNDQRPATAAASDLEDDPTEQVTAQSLSKRAGKRTFHLINRQATVAMSDSETSENECRNNPTEMGSCVVAGTGDQSTKRPKAANDLIRRSSQRETLEEALRLLADSSKMPADSELYEWARHYVQHTWLKAAARRTADAAQVDKFLRLVEARGQQLLELVVNICDENDNSALHYAVSHGNFDVVSLLLDCAQCQLDKSNKAGYTPAMLAALSADLTDTSRVVMQRLFQMADVNIRTKQHGQTAIMLAASHGKIDAVTMLIENGADVNMQDEDGSTALMCAAEHGHKEIVRLLLDLPQIEASMVDKEGSTALAIAVENGYKDIGLLIYAHLNHDHSSWTATRDYL